MNGESLLTLWRDALAVTAQVTAPFLLAMLAVIRGDARARHAEVESSGQAYDGPFAFCFHGYLHGSSSCASSGHDPNQSACRVGSGILAPLLRFCVNPT